MTTVTGLTAQRMQEIEAASIIDGDVVGGNLILTKHDGTQINAGPVLGPAGPQGPAGIAAAPIPGEIKLWPSTTLPEPVAYGNWTWGNGDIFDIATYPEAAANIDDAWNTAMGLSAPPAGKFRVPDLRGLVPAGPDAMPVGAARANRLTRTIALTLAAKTGEEVHIISIPELPSHTHVQNGHGHTVGQHDHALSMAAGPQSNTIFPTGGGGVVTDRGGGGAGQPVKLSAVLSAASVVATNQNTGGGGSHENVQPTIIVPYIVKLDD
jgi:microcystin-dependent protein